jgi:hypothetical protein
MFVRVRTRFGQPARALQVRCRQELQRALTAAGLRFDWAVFFFEEEAAAEPGESRHRCVLALGRRGGSARSVEVQAGDADSALQSVVARAVAALTRTAPPPAEQAPVADVVALPHFEAPPPDEAFLEDPPWPARFPSKTPASRDRDVGPARAARDSDAED